MKQNNIFEQLNVINGDMDAVFTESVSEESLVQEDAIPLTKTVEEKETKKVKGPHSHLSDDELHGLMGQVEDLSKSDHLHNSIRSKMLDYHSELAKEFNDRKMSKEVPEEDLSDIVGHGLSVLALAQNPVS